MVEGEEFTWKRPRTAGAWDFERWANAQKGKGVKLIKNPKAKDFQVGDIVVFKFSHIGLCVGESDDNTIPTIEGNTDDSGSREGGGVYEKVRSINKVRSIIRII